MAETSPADTAPQVQLTQSRSRSSLRQAAGEAALDVIAQDAAALRQGAREDADGAEEEEHESGEESEDLEDSDEEGDEPPPLPPAAPVIAKLYAIPRDYKQIVEVAAEVVGREVKCKPIGPHYGEKSASKFVNACKAAKEDAYYCVPYDGRKVLKVDMKGPAIETGKTFRKEGGKYTEACSSLNAHGCMYAAPCRAQRVLEIDTQNNSIKEVGPVLGSKTINKWWAIAPSCSGRIYAAPYDAPRVLEIDPNRGGVSKMVGPDLGPMKGKYCSIAEAPNGNLYCAPLNAGRVLEINAEGKVRLVGPDFGEQEKKYCCIVAAPNKLLYAPPLYADYVIEINCARGDVRPIGEMQGVGEAKYASCCVAPYNGRVYCPPLEARKVLEIDCEGHDVELIGLDLGGAQVEKYSAISAGPEGCDRLYAAPRNAHNFLEICPRRAYVREVGSDHGRCPRKFACIVPGVLWQGGMLIEDYKKKRDKQEADHQAKLAKFHQRQAHRASVFLPQHALTEGLDLRRGSTMSQSPSRASISGTPTAASGSPSRKSIAAEPKSSPQKAASHSPSRASIKAK